MSDADKVFNSNFMISTCDKYARYEPKGSVKFPNAVLKIDGLSCPLWSGLTFA